LTVNFEWNIKVNSLENGKIVKSILETFNKEFDNLKTLTEEDIENYQKKYEQLKKLIEVNNQNLDLDEIKPNSMQVQALKNLEEGIIVEKTLDTKMNVNYLIIQNKNNNFN